jgi:hypothetical protein
VRELGMGLEKGGYGFGNVKIDEICNYDFFIILS